MLAKSKLKIIKVLISKALIDSNINHDEFILINVLKEFYDMKEEIKNSNDKRLYKRISSYCLKCRKNTESQNPKVVRTKNGRIIQDNLDLHTVLVNRLQKVKNE